jgi:phage FluMu protein Com
MEKVILNEYRCDNCGKLLFKGKLEECIIEIKCRRCAEIKIFDYSNKRKINSEDG